MPASDAMACPLCGAQLTTADRDKNGRFHCSACMPTSAEAQRGWLPRARPLVAAAQAPQRGLTSIAHDPMFGVNAAGDPITRERTCECGSRFTQRQLSARFLESAERFSAAAIDGISRQVPGYFVPVHCPPCERRDMHRQNRIEQIRLDEVQHAAD
jgi:ribosomal protein S27E